MKLNLVGQVFGRLTVLRELAQRSGKKEVRWECSCECGNTHIVVSALLMRGGVRSCGCLKREGLVARNIRHGLATRKNTPQELYIWSAMKRRCYRPKAAMFDLYGGKGITVCDRWLDPVYGFKNFFADMGPRPGPSYSLDRIDGTGMYSPDNCRWATKIEQSRNRIRANIFLGRCLVDWAEEFGISEHRLNSRYRNRIRKGWAPFPALFTPEGEPPIAIS